MCVCVCVCVCVSKGVVVYSACVVFVLITFCLVKDNLREI